MSKVADAATDVGGGSWFKVSEEGYDSTTKTWAVASNDPKILLVDRVVAMT
jgi:cellulase